MSAETFENCGNFWYLEYYLLLFCRETLYIGENIKYLAKLWIMNKDFHNISRFLAQFWYVFLRKFEFLTKRVCGRIDTFSMSGRLKHLKRRILLQQVLPREKSPFYSYCSKYNVRNRLFNKPLGHSFLDKVANICFARSQNNEKWS